MASWAFAAACRRFGVRHVWTKPYTPKTNGGAELHPDGHEGVGLRPAPRDTGPAGRKRDRVQSLAHCSATQREPDAEKFWECGLATAQFCDEGSSVINGDTCHRPRCFAWLSWEPDAGEGLRIPKRGS